MALNLRSIGNAVRATLRFLEGSAPAPQARPRPRSGRHAQRPARATARAAGAAGRGSPERIPATSRASRASSYAPSPNGLPEPGEVVWTWVPYEEDHSQGKDRPVLLVGSHGRYLLGLMLTSKDHDQRPPQ